MLKRFFTAKWQHKDESIRQQALIDFDSVKDTDIILKMVTDDPSQEIRNQALSKLKDAKHIEVLLEKAASPVDWVSYALKLNDISPQLQSLVTSFNKIKVKWPEEQVIKAIASCKEPLLANALLAASDDSKTLFEMAKNAKSIECRLEAVAKIDDLDELHRLVKESTNKQVLKAAKLKLSDARLAQKHHQELQLNTEDLVLTMEKLSQQSWLDPQFEIKVKSLVDKWQHNENELITINSAKLQQAILELKVKFLTSLDICYDRILKNQDEIQQAAIKQDAINKHQELCSQLNKLVAEINEPVDSEKTSVEKFQSIKSANEFLLKSWSQTVSIVKPEVKLQEQYDSLNKSLDSYFKAWDKLIELESEVNDHINSQPKETFVTLNLWLEKWSSLQKKLSWPKEFVKPDVLVSWFEKATIIKEINDKIVVSQKKKAAYINQKIKLLEKECQRKNLLAANKLSNYINLQLEALNPEFRASIVSRIEKTQPLLEELRDWHSFATTPKKQALCEAMEFLQTQEIDALEKANKVRSLQQQWRELKASNAIADEALWDRFKIASDTAYLPCLAFYAKQDKIKADNLHKKIAICDRLEQIIKDNDWALNDLPEINAESDSIENGINQSDKVIDWKSIDQLISKLNKEWNKLQPVPDNERLSIQQHFDSAAKIIRDKIKQEKQSNLDLRCELVEKANQLIALEEIDKAIKGALKLQKEWKLIGLTFYKADREQWFLFRAAIDKVFNKRDQINQSNKAELKKNQQLMIDLTQQVNVLLKVSDQELRASYEQYELIRNQKLTETDLPKASASKIINQFDKACGDYQSHCDGLEGRLQKLKLDSLIKGALLLQQSEEKMLSNAAVLSSEEKEQLAQALENLYLDHHDKDLLNTRLQSILDCKDVLENTEGTNQLLQIALDLEIQLSIESPPEYAQQRMAIQLEKLKQGMGASLADSEKSELVLNALKTWLSIGFVEPSARIVLESRKAKIVGQI